MAEYSLKAVAKVVDPHTIKRLNNEQVGQATRHLHIITDWLLRPVPLIIIWRTQMRLSKKLRLMSVFAVGLTPDFTYDYYSIYAWDVVDIFFATIVASLPALNGVIDWSATKVWTWGSRSGYLLRGRIFTLGRSWNRSHSGPQGLPTSNDASLAHGKNDILRLDSFGVTSQERQVYLHNVYEPAPQNVGTCRERQEYTETTGKR